MAENDLIDVSVGPFRLTERCGSGGAGEVWRANHVATGTPAAVKVITPALARGEQAVASFQREARAMARLAHPCIVRIFDYGRVDAHAAGESRGRFAAGSPYLATEFAPDGSLLDVLRYGIGWDQLKDILRSVLEALAHSHARGVLHRDIKPANVLAGRHRDRRSWKLTDFGIAHSIHIHDPNSPDELAGTPAYMAPEQFSGTWRDFGPPTDLYSVGCMAFQLITGEVPFDAPQPLAVGLKHIEEPIPSFPGDFPTPDGLEEWVHRLMQKNPAERFQKASDAIRALEDVEDIDPSIQTVNINDSESPTQLDASASRLPPPLPADIGGEEGDTLPDSWATGERFSIWAEPPSAPQGNATAPHTPARPIDDWRDEGEHYDHSLLGVSPRLFGLREIPIVGREFERDKLWRALRTVATTREPRVALISAPSGYGKSRLTRWLCERADELGAANWVRAQHTQDVSESGGLASMLIRWGRLDNLDDNSLRARLQKLLNIDDPMHWLVQDLLRMLGSFEPDFTERTNRTNLIRPVLEVLRRAASSRPLIVWLEDLQWGEMAIRLLEAVTTGEQLDVPILFCATVQSEELAQRKEIAHRIEVLAQQPDVDFMTLSPMDLAETRRLVERLLLLDDDLTDRVARRVEGNPLFTVQLIGDWIDRGWLVPTEDGFRLRQGLRPKLPDNLHDIWAERVDHALKAVEGSNATVLYIAALLGMDVDLYEWREACSQMGLTANIDLIQHLADLELVKMTSNGWQFIHGMLRESLLRLARDSGQWAELNASTAEALEHLSEETPGREHSAKIGRLLARAGEYERAVPFLLAGANQFQMMGDRATALELVDFLIDACDRVGPLVARQKLDGLLIRARAISGTRRLEEAVEITEHVREVALERGWKRIAADALEHRCVLEHRRGRVHGSAYFARKALELYEDVGHQEGATRAKLRLGDHAAFLGDQETALDYYNDCLDSARAHGLNVCMAQALWGIGYAHHQRLELREAVEPYVQALELFRESGLEREALSVLSCVADLDRLAGRLDLAERRYMQLYRFVRKRDGRDSVVAANIAFTHLLRGDDEQLHQWRIRARRHTNENDRGWPYVYALGLIELAGKDDVFLWKERVEKLVELVERSGFVDIDLALMLEIAAARAEAHGYNERAETPKVYATEVWNQLGLQDKAPELVEKITARERRRT